MFKPNARPVISAPNVIPMADVMLVLLVIFMVITPMIRRGAPVRMANAQNAEKIPSADRDDAIIVAVTRDGNFFLSPGNREVTLTALSSDVKDLVAGRLDKTVYVRSDARAKYGDVVKAVDQIRAIGIENIGMLTEKTPNKPPTVPPTGALN
jgi:biopolymer transport protein ExbD/biopolymer transport protein TolR